MEIEETSLHGVRVFRPEPKPDDRGWFLRVFSADTYGDAGVDHTRMVQQNQSRSRYRVLRGLHTRSNLSEAKLVRCAHGRVFDVVVDLRPWSPTFLEWESFILDDETHRQVYIPPGFAHGFEVLSESADVSYWVDAFYDPSLDVAVAWDDPELGIDWPLDDPIVSKRDQAASSLAEVKPHLSDWYGSDAPG